MVCPVPVAKAKGLIDNERLSTGSLTKYNGTMNNVGDKLRQSMQKRKEALESFKLKEAGFLKAKKQILHDIEEARTIWNETLKKLPKQPFSS